MNVNKRKWLLGATGVCLIALGGYFVYPYGILFGLWQPLFRPAGISRLARYVSVIEDGSWIDCSIDSARDVNICKAWYYDGRLRVSGDFRFEDQHRAATKEELNPSMVAGPDAIYLFDRPRSGTIRAHALYRVGTPVKGIVE